MIEQYYIFILLALISEIIGTISGFGSSILFVPIASLFFDFKTVLGITAVFHVFSNLSKIALFRKGVHQEIALKLGLPAIAFVILGAWLTAFVPAQPMVLAMNFVLVILAIYLLLHLDKTVEATNSNLYWGGILSGLLAGLVGTGGAVRGLTLAAFSLPKDVFIATSALIDLGVDTSRALVYVVNGYVEKGLLFLIPFLIGVSFVGSYLGKVILKYTSENAFRYIVLVTIVLTTTFNLLKYFNFF